MRMDYTVRPYEKSDFEKWNAFIAEARNATFLFDRNFMEYHSDRFHDHSMIIAKGDVWLAVLPGHIKENAYYSHYGLTYGGFVYGMKMKLASLIDITKSVLKYLNDNKITTFYVKAIPSIYHQKPSDDLLYALFLSDAKLIRRDALSVIDRLSGIKITKTRREAINRGVRNGLIIIEEPNFELFWNKILIPNLDAKHDAKPVHTAGEMQLLHRRFPENIRHFNVYKDDEIVAGTTVFISKNVAHPQYVSGQKDKNELGSLDFLYHHLITEVFTDRRFFDFGISNEDQGRKLNEGLLFWKESFGAGTVTQDFYEVPTANYHLFDQVII